MTMMRFEGYIGKYTFTNPVLVMAWMLLLYVYILALSPLWVPAHFVLKHYGRRGFAGPGPNISLTRKAFRRVQTNG